MAREPNHEPLYAAAECFVDQGLRRDGSLFTPGEAIWTLEAADDLYDRFIVHADERKGVDFDVKLFGQLDGASAATIQFTAELLYVFLLIPAGIRAQTKHAQIASILGLLPEVVKVPSVLDTALRLGVANFGTGFQRKPEYVRYLLQFVRHWKGLAAIEWDRALDDPWGFKAVTHQVSAAGAQAAREGLLHLVFPDTFEPTVSVAQKQAIAKRFSYLVSEPTDDVDRQLLQIHEHFQIENPERPFNFYGKLMRPAWDPQSKPWDRFIYWAARLYEHPGFDEDERVYKLEVANLSRAARDALRAGQPDWLDILKRSFGPTGNLVNWRNSSRFLEWCREEPEDAKAGLLAIWDESNELPARLDTFLHVLPEDVARGTSARLSIATNLLLGSDATSLPPYRYEPIHAGYRLADYPVPDSKASDTEVYFHALAFFDKILAEARDRGLELRDRLDAQSVLWAVTKTWSLPAAWPPAEQSFLEAYRQDGGAPELVDDGDDGGDEVERPDPVAATSDEAVSLETLTNELLLDAGWLNDVVELLKAKRQIIFYGPPGTGKTYVALRLAQHLMRYDEGPAIVQFHPSYAYEDFVQGFRPGLAETGQPAFRLVDGPLLRAADAARSNPGRPHLLIIDEINRGNLARVLGELYFLLEYRDRQISLQYSDTPFALPDNLWIIGTMNTADRSIALIDAALRRRFFFVPFFPDAVPVRGLLGRWLARHHPDLVWLAGAVDQANDMLNDRHLSIGPSYFMRDDLDEAWVRRIWDYQIVPYLEEHFFDDPRRVDEFKLDRLRVRPAVDGRVLDEETDLDDDIEPASAS